VLPIKAICKYVKEDTSMILKFTYLNNLPKANATPNKPLKFVLDFGDLPRECLVAQLRQFPKFSVAVDPKLLGNKRSKRCDWA
jgi:hypothetical protein